MVIPENSAEVMNFIPEHSTNSICVGDSTTLCLTDYLESLEGDVAAKAPMSHSHGEYLSEDDAVAAFAMADHTHTGYAPASHTHSDLVETMDALDTAIGGKAEAVHTHAQADVTGLVEKLAEIDEAIEALQAAGGESGGAPAPILTLSMHKGKLDNNSGAEVSSSTRICSEPFAVQNGKSYWQVNDKGVNMYALLYDADEVFLAYLGSFDSGAEIAVNNADAGYMRLGSLLGEYDLTNNFYIYDVDPAGGAVEEEGFTQADADLLYAPISHTHDGYAAAEHTHDGFAAADHTHSNDHTHANQAVLDGITVAKVAAWDAGTGNGSGTAPVMDDVIEGTLSNATTFRDDLGVKILAESGKIYVDTTTNKCYRWSGSTYVEIGGGGVALGETSATAHRGDHGKIAYDHSQNADVHVTAAQKNSWDSKADATHGHSEYAAASHGHSEYAYASDLSGKADAGHTHTASQVGAAAASHTHTYTEVGAASSSHTHTPASIGAAASSHTHSGYASSTHTHDYAASNHSHSGYASSTHTHSNYASSSHSHTAANVGALPTSGGTITGDLTVMGTEIFNGVMYTQTIYPKDAGSYSIGSSDNRYYSTYLKVNPNVSSDRRCKRDIAIMDVDALAAFVDKLPVVSYNYNDDAADEAKRIGLIAQDVVAADPEIAKGCIEQDEKGFYSLRAADLVFPLIAAVQVLTKRVEDLEGK